MSDAILAAIAMRVRAILVEGADPWDVRQLVDLVRSSSHNFDGEIVSSAINLGERLCRENQPDAERMAVQWSDSAVEQAGKPPTSSISGSGADSPG